MEKNTLNKTMTIENIIERLKELNPKKEVKVGTIFGLLNITSIDVKDNYIQITTY